MAELKKLCIGRYEVWVEVDTVPPVELPALVDGLARARRLEGKGRGGISIANIAGGPIAFRKYIHGGLFGGITGDIFFSGKRAIDEFRIMLYLKEKGFPVVRPFCVVIEKHFLTKTPHILTHYEENSVDLMDFLNGASQRVRYGTIKILAELMWRLGRLGIYHPDLHLNNVLVHRGTKALLFLDFDSARRKPISEEDMERMFWRLNRYAEKMERKGRLKVSAKEKLLFLRIYRRLSGIDMAGRMMKKAGRKRLLSRMGWFFERLFYRDHSDSKFIIHNS